jgi:hypothetical protein
MKPVNFTGIRQYPKRRKDSLWLGEGKIHQLENEIFKGNPPATHNATGEPTWRKRHFRPTANFRPVDVRPFQYESPKPIFGEPAPIRNRLKPSDEYVWTPVHRRSTENFGELVIETNSRGEFRFKLGEYTSLSVYADKPSVIEAISRYATNGEKDRQDTRPASHYSDSYDPEMNRAHYSLPMTKDA